MTDSTRRASSRLQARQPGPTPPADIQPESVERQGRSVSKRRSTQPSMSSSVPPNTRSREASKDSKNRKPRAQSRRAQSRPGSDFLKTSEAHSKAQSESGISDGYTDQPGNTEEVEKKRPKETLMSSELATRTMNRLWNKDEFVNMAQWCFDHGIQFEPMDENWFLQPRFSIHIQGIYAIFKRAEIPNEVWTKTGIQPTQTILEEGVDYKRLKAALGEDEIQRIVSHVSREAATLNRRTTAPTEEEWRRVWNLVLVPCYHHIFEANHASSPKMLVGQGRQQSIPPATMQDPKLNKDPIAFWEEHFINYPRFELYNIASHKPEEIVHATYVEKVVEPFSKRFTAFYEEEENWPQNAQEVNAWTERLINAIKERKTHAKAIGVSMSHERFLNRLSRYPPHGRYDAAIVLHDDTIFDAVHKELKGRGIPNAEQRTREKLSIFECCVTQGKFRFPGEWAAKSKGKQSAKAPMVAPANVPRDGAGVLSTKNQGTSDSTESVQKSNRRTTREPRVANVDIIVRIWNETTNGPDLSCIAEDPTDGDGDNEDGVEPNSSKSDSQREFLVPLVLIEHKRKDTDEEERPLEYSGNNQRLMYSTSSARFLHALGMLNASTFGITTAGSRATVSAAWCTENPELGIPLTHVIQKDHPLLTFDIADKEDCVHFMIFLFRLSSVCQELWDQYLSRKAEIVKSIADTNDDKYWTAYSQRKELGIGSKESQDKDRVRMKVVKDIDEPEDDTT